MQVIINITLETLARPHITAAGPERLSPRHETDSEEAGVGASPMLQAEETKTKRQPLVLAASKPKGSAPVHCRGETL